MGIGFRYRYDGQRVGGAREVEYKFERYLNVPRDFEWADETTSPLTALDPALVTSA